jgi:hypothetical protein
VPIDLSTLQAADAKGYDVLEALSHEGRMSPTFSSAHTFICVDGKTYWVKASAQQGLVAELIAGRLASRTSAGPAARIIRVTPEAVPADGSANHLIGVVVGSEDERSTVNTRELALLAPGRFNPGAVDAASRALVVAFQTWLGVGDVQVLVNLSTGHLRSIDHGECFTTTGQLTDPVLVVLSIQGMADDVGRDDASIDSAASRIEAVTDQQLTDAVARIPLGDPWKSPADRRLEIANWLAHRRGKIREVMAQWH